MPFKIKVWQLILFTIFAFFYTVNCKNCACCEAYKVSGHPEGSKSFDKNGNETSSKERYPIRLQGIGCNNGCACSIWGSAGAANYRRIKKKDHDQSNDDACRSVGIIWSDWEDITAPDPNDNTNDNNSDADQDNGNDNTYTKPTLEIVSPKSGNRFQSGDVINIESNFTRDSRIPLTEMSINYYVNGEKLNSPEDVSENVNWSAPNVEGMYDIEAEIFDGHGNSANAKVTIQVGLSTNTAPEVTFTSPIEGEEFVIPYAGQTDDNPLLIAVSAKDDNGIDHLEYYLDGDALACDEQPQETLAKTKADITSCPIKLASDLKEGTYQIWVKVVDKLQLYRYVKINVDLVKTPLSGTLNSITFCSDQAILKHNSSNWKDEGQTYSEPEWSAVSPERNYPITQTKNTNLVIKANIKVLPPGVSYTLNVDGPNDYLDATISNLIATGKDEIIDINLGKIPDAIDVLKFNLKYSITATSNGTTQNKVIGTSGEHVVYVTYGTPLIGITDKRVSEAVMLLKGEGNDPFCILQRVNEKFPLYGVDKYFGSDEEVWKIGDILLDETDACVTAECQAVARFIRKVAMTAGIPGNLEPIAVYADPLNPQIPLEGEITDENGNNGTKAYIPSPPNYYTTWLVDGSGGKNYLEGSLKYSYNGITRYYPGGLGGRVDLNADEVLKCSFALMAYTYYDDETGKDVFVTPPITIYNCPKTSVINMCK